MVDASSSEGSLCDVDARTVEIDCNYFGVECSAGFCNNQGDPKVKGCAPTDIGLTSCDGTQLVICNGLADIKFDCSAIEGSGACAERSGIKS